MKREIAGLALAGMLGLAGCVNQEVPVGRGAADEGTAGEFFRRQADAPRGRIWELSFDGVRMRHMRSGEVVRIALPGVLWAGEPYACLPDLAIGPRGEAVVTSNVVPVLWRIDPATLAVTSHPLALDADRDQDVGLTTLTYSPAHAAYYGIGGAGGALWKIDTALKRASKIAPEAGPARGRPCTEPVYLGG